MTPMPTYGPASTPSSTTTGIASSPSSTGRRSRPGGSREVFWTNAEGKQGQGDYSTLNAAPVFTGRAVEALSDLLEGRGELLPLTVLGGSEAYAFNTTRLSDSLDRDRSEYDYYSSGTGRIMSVEDYVFDPARVADETIFKLAILPRGFEYVTDRFRHRVEQAGLTGFRWAPVWTGA